MISSKGLRAWSLRGCSRRDISDTVARKFLSNGLRRALRSKIDKHGGIFLYILAFVFYACAAMPVSARDDGGMAVTYHRVARYDDLSLISRRYNVDIKTIMEYNGLRKPTDIRVGQKLAIPVKGSQPVQVRQEGSSVFVPEKNFIWPVKGLIVSNFGSMRSATVNDGIDISCSLGKDIVAAMSGKVSFVSDSLKGYGKTIIIDHGRSYQTVYAYNSENLVQSGEVVRQGQIIARSGKGGRAKTSSLHFEIRKEYKPVNPVPLLK